MSNPGGASISAEQLKARYIGTGHADMTKQYETQLLYVPQQPDTRFLISFIHLILPILAVNG
jgi:hypothetical protein